MYTVEAPKKWTSINGSVSWPAVEDFSEAHWETYIGVLDEYKAKKENIDRLHFEWAVTAAFTAQHGVCTLTVKGEKVDIKAWIDDKAQRRIAVMNWLVKEFDIYLNKHVLDPKD